MKKIIVIFLCVSGFLWLIFQSYPKLPPAPVSPSIVPVNTPTPVVPNGLLYTMDDQSFRVASFTVKNPPSILLIPNFTEKISSLTSAERNRCAVLTSAGFYSTESKPIGLFVADGKKQNNYEKNTLFNGYIWVDHAGVATISDELPPETSRIALQTGPLLISNGTPKKLAIRNDEPARRIVVALTNDTAIVFLALFGDENTFEGPKLADVPKHLTTIEHLLGISIVDAINLDGGSASAFITNDHSLTELTPVGSFFCVRT